MSRLFPLAFMMLALLLAPHPAMAQAAPKTASASAAPSPGQKRKAQEFYLRGVRAMDRGDVHKAEKDFARAARADPTHREYDVDREIARQDGITGLIQQAAKAEILGHRKIAKEKLAQAMELDPKNPEVAQHMDDLENLPAEDLPPEEATATIAPPIEIEPSPGKQSFHFKGTQQEVLRRVLDAYGLGVTVDGTVAMKTIRFDADQVDYAHAAELLQLATDSFIVALDPKRVLVARDTKENRAKYERLSEETLHLPGLTTAEISDMGNIARTVFSIPQTTVQQQSGTLTVRAPLPSVIALNRTLADLLQGRSEVLLDVRLFELGKTRTRNIGVQLPQTLTLFNVPSELNNIIQQNQSLVQQIISSGLANAGDNAAIAAILIASGEVSGSILGQPFALFGGGLTESGLSLPGVTANLALNSTDTRSLDRIQLRLLDKEEGTIRSGTRYPIVTSSYSNIAGPSVSIPGLNSAGLSSTLAGLGVNLNGLTAQPIPQVQYQDLGLSLNVTPSIGQGDNVALKLTFKLTALQGTSLNGLPVLTNENYTAQIVVPSGAGALLVSNLSRSQSKAVTGAPGLSELPGFQSTTNNQSELDVSQLVILITPHLVRRGHGERAGPYIPLPRHG